MYDIGRRSRVQIKVNQVTYDLIELDWGNVRLSVDRARSPDCRRLIIAGRVLFNGI